MSDNRTIELREKLTERGVKWWDAATHKTKWHSTVLDSVVAVSEWNGKMVLDAGYETVTPEQAIAATLGSGTCENEWAQFGKFRCSECWTQVDAISTNTTAPIPIKYCPKCGAKIVQGVDNAD